MPRCRKPPEPEKEKLKEFKKWSKLPPNSNMEKWAECFEKLDNVSIKDCIALDTEDANDDLVLDEQVIQDELSNVSKVTVKMKLSQFCKDENMKRKIDSIVIKMNKLIAEAYEFANFYITELLSTPNPTIPAVATRDFYYRCILAVSVNKCKSRTLSQGFTESMERFDMLRPVDDVKVDIRMYNQIVASLSISMATMAFNHLLTNLETRLMSYLKLFHKDIKRLHKHIYIAVVLSPKDNVNGILKNMKSCTPYQLATAKDIIAEFRNLISNTKPKYATNAHLTLPMYFKFLKDIEQAEEEEKRQYEEAKKKGINIKKIAFKTFSLLPTKNGFTISNIQISSMAFMGILKEMNYAKFTNDGRDEDQHQLWAKYFNLNYVETKARRFSHCIVTDGYSVSVIMNKSSNLVCTEEKADQGTLKLLHKEYGSYKNENALPNPVDFRAVDPGLTDVATVASIDGSVTSYSSAKYYDRAKVFLSQRRIKKWNAETLQGVLTIPKKHTSSLDRLKEHIKSYLMYLPILLKDRAKKGYRAMRFLRYIHKKQALNEICDFIAPKNKITVLGFGNWTGPKGSPIKRRCAGPLQEIKLQLKGRDNVFFVNVHERRTSITCHNCLCRLCNMKAVSVKKGKNETLVKSKIHKVLHCRNSQSDSLSHCGTTWNRDANASKNILMLLMYQVLDWPRPDVF